LAPATVNFTVQQVGGIFNWAIENEITEKNPCKGVKNLKVDNARKRYLELDEIKKLKETIKNDKFLYYFVLVSLATGGRLQTICNIKPSDIKSNGMIRLFDFKNNSEYFGFLNDDLRNELKSFINEFKKEKDDFIFQITPHHSYTDQYYQRRLKPILDVLFNPKGTKRLDKVMIHTFRHTFASQLAINETPILTIKKLMNHANITSTMIYAKLNKSSGEKHVDNLIKSLMDV
jgi:site-specific recombinase XerD